MIDLTLVYGSWDSETSGGGTVTVFEAKTRQECIDALAELNARKPGPRNVDRMPVDKNAEAQVPVVTHYPLLPGTPEYEQAVAIREQIRAGTIKTVQVDWPDE